MCNILVQILLRVLQRAGWRLEWAGWRWMDLGGGWNGLSGGEWSWVELGGGGWSWVHGLVIPIVLNVLKILNYFKYLNSFKHLLSRKFLYCCLIKWKWHRTWKYEIKIVYLESSNSVKIKKFYFSNTNLITMYFLFWLQFVKKLFNTTHIWKVRGQYFFRYWRYATTWMDEGCSDNVTTGLALCFYAFCLNYW